MFGSIIAAVLATATGGETQAAPTTANLDWREGVRCGPNCLYVMLFMFGKKPDYARLMEMTEVTDRGASAAELVRVAEHFGLRLRVVRADVSALARLPLPAIVHFQNAGEHGHFVLLLYEDTDDDKFTVLDCTRGEMTRMHRGDFYDLWTGVALLEAGAWRDHGSSRLVAFTSAFAAVMAAIACATAWCRKRRDFVSSVARMATGRGIPG